MVCQSLSISPSFPGVQVVVAEDAGGQTAASPSQNEVGRSQGRQTQIPHVICDVCQRSAVYHALHFTEDCSQDFVRWQHSALLHGDYWLGNLIYHDHAIAAVIDWQDASVGDPLADLAIARIEQAWMLGADSMESFTQHYAACTRIDMAYLPLWDLTMILRPAVLHMAWEQRPDVRASLRRTTRRFIEQALENAARL